VTTAGRSSFSLHDEMAAPPPPPPALASGKTLGGITRLVYAHIGRPAIRAMDAGLRPPFGEWGIEGRTYTLPDPMNDTRTDR
jgi:hypothetical protein